MNDPLNFPHAHRQNADSTPVPEDAGVEAPHAGAEPAELQAAWPETDGGQHGANSHEHAGQYYWAPPPVALHRHAAPHETRDVAVAPEPHVAGHTAHGTDTHWQDPGISHDDDFGTGYPPAQSHTPFEAGDRDFAEELRRLINEPEPAAPRRRHLASPIAKIAGIAVISAAAALLVVTLGDISAPGTDGAPIEHETATEETDIAANGTAVPAAAEDEADAPMPPETASSATRSQFGPSEARAAEQSSGWVPVATPDRDSVRQIEVMRPSDQGFGETPAERAGLEGSWSPPTADAASEPADAFGETAGTPDEEPTAAPSLEMAVPADDPPSVAGAAQSAQTTADVNLRDAPENDATVLAVIPADGEVELIGCDIWCEVLYDGQQGWVYRDFIAGAP